MENWIITATLAFLAAGTIKGTLGLGLPITAIGLMTLLIDVRLAIALMVFPILFTNVWQIYRAGNVLETARKYAVFAIILMVSLLLTTFLTTRVSTDFLVGLIGLAVIMFCIINLMFNPPLLSDRFDKAGQCTAGLVSGILGGFTAIWAPPIAAYLILRKTGKEEFVRATGFLFLTGSIPLCAGFWFNGMLSGPVAMVSAGMIIPTLLGFSIGEKIRANIPQEKFKIVVLVFFLIIGVNLLRKSFLPGILE